MIHSSHSLSLHNVWISLGFGVKFTLYTLTSHYRIRNATRFLFASSIHRLGFMLLMDGIVFLCVHKIHLTQMWWDELSRRQSGLLEPKFQSIFQFKFMAQHKMMTRKKRRLNSKKKTVSVFEHNFRSHIALFVCLFTQEK